MLGSKEVHARQIHHRSVSLVFQRLQSLTLIFSPTGQIGAEKISNEFCLGTASIAALRHSPCISTVCVFAGFFLGQCLNYDKHAAVIGVKQALSGRTNRFTSANRVLLMAVFQKSKFSCRSALPRLEGAFAQRTKGTALPTTVLQLNSLSLLTKAEPFRTA